MSQELAQSSAPGSAYRPEPIAIVGVGCRLPGDIDTIDELLVALREGRDCVTEVPPDRWNVDEFYDPDMVAPGKTYVRDGGFVSDVDRFDAGFFGVSHAEASRMDPQQRMLLHTVWHALEHAGQSSDELFESNTGVFLAMMNTNGYAQLKGLFEGLRGVTAYDAMGDAMSITAGRVSHFLGIRGPCFALDTACSGSLVALHQARQSILSGDCDSAIVAGVSAILHPGIHIAFSKIGLMSRGGRCRAFDEAADGYTRGEGCVAVLLRRQSLAVARGDRILASIVGTAINHDGRTPALTAPNGRTQEKVIRTALARVGVSQGEVGYVEAHGTGTPVGDPIEMSALASVFGPGRTEDNPLYVGSVKSNFGHIEAGAGLLGMVKAALSLHTESILPSLHFNKMNPNIDLGRAPIRVPTEVMPWPRGERPRMAGVNSFGYSGTNAHAILQEAPLPADDTEADSLTRSSEMILLSAKSSGCLENLVDLWTDFLNVEDDAPLHDLAFVAATGRSHMNHRVAAVGKDKAEIREKLRAWREGRGPRGLSAGQKTGRTPPKVAFVFTGQGAQIAHMGRALYEQEDRFAAAIDRVAAAMDRHLDVPIKDVLFGEDSASHLENTRYVQPALFAIEYALTEQLRDWGIEPDMVIGHSVGEIVAACVAGVFELEDAARFIVARGQLMGDLPAGGTMAALTATHREALEWIGDRDAEVSLAAANGPNAVVVSGTTEAVSAVAGQAEAAGRRVKGLDVSHAFHSPLMDSILEPLREVVDRIRINPPRIPVVSNVTGEFLSDRTDGAYWSDHVRQPVLFHQGMTKIIDAGATVLIEIGPRPTLTPAIVSSFDMSAVRCAQTLRRRGDDFANLLDTLASLHVNGTPIRLERLFWSSNYRRVTVPLYPFRRDRHWLRADLSDSAAPEIADDLHPILGEATAVTSRRIGFDVTLSAAPPWTDHRVLGSTVYPGTAYLERVGRGLAAFRGSDWQAVVLKEVAYERPLILKYRKERIATLTIDEIPANTGEARFSVSAENDGVSETLCRGRVTITDDDDVTMIDLPALLERRGDSMHIGTFYAQLRSGGLEYGSGFANVRELWKGAPGSGEAFGRVALSAFEGQEVDNPYASAVLLDGSLHVFAAALQTLEDVDLLDAFIPTTIQAVTLTRELPNSVWSHVTAKMVHKGQAALITVRVMNDEGEVLAVLDGMELRRKTSLSMSGGRPAKRSGSTVQTQSRNDLLKTLHGAADKAQQVQVLTKWLTLEVKDIMGAAAEGIDFDKLDPTLAFLEIGLDSLLVTELQRRIQEKLDFRFQPMQGLDYQSIESLAKYILDEVMNLEIKDDNEGGSQ